MKQHPLYYILASLAGVLSGAAILELIPEAWNDSTFWLATAFAILGILGALSVDLFRHVCRYYPLLRCCGRSSNSDHLKQH